MTSMTEIQDALTALLPKLGENLTKIDDVQRLSGGASQETWKFNACTAESQHPMILRRAPNGVWHNVTDGQAIGLSTEAAIIRAARRFAVPAPGVVYVGTRDDGIGNAYIMDFVPGETIARKILRDDAFIEARPKLAAQCGDALARIHAIPHTDLPELPASPIDAQIERYETIYRSFDAPRPVFELAFQWLKANAPAQELQTLVHGDFRHGNLMVGPDGLQSVLDWELCHFGDPREDIGWICVNSWRFGVSEKQVGGFGDLEDLLEAYAAAGGRRFSTDDIAYWEMLGSLKWGIMCMMMYGAFASGGDPSVERAAIGRRSSETEIDLINILERLP